MNVKEGVVLVNQMLVAEKNPSLEALLQKRFEEILWVRFLNEMKRTVIVDWNKPIRYMTEEEKKELAKFLFNIRGD